MKKIFLTIAVMASTFHVIAQKVNEAEVPAVVKQQFKTLFGDATTANWEKEKNNYEANFKKDNNHIFSNH